jgi:hypothetical protein
MLAGLDHQEQSVVVLRGDFDRDIDFRSERLGDNTGDDEQKVRRKREQWLHPWLEYR